MSVDACGAPPPFPHLGVSQNVLLLHYPAETREKRRQTTPTKRISNHYSNWNDAIIAGVDPAENWARACGLRLKLYPIALRRRAD
jgi:hypothetical protein